MHNQSFDGVVCLSPPILAFDHSCGLKCSRPLTQKRLEDLGWFFVFLLMLEQVAMAGNHPVFCRHFATAASACSAALFWMPAKGLSGIKAKEPFRWARMLPSFYHSKKPGISANNRYSLVGRIFLGETWSWAKERCVLLLTDYPLRLHLHRLLPVRPAGHSHGGHLEVPHLLHRHPWRSLSSQPSGSSGSLGLLAW